MAIVASQPAGVRAVPDARLRNLEYDVLLRQAFYTERAPLAVWLRRIADRVAAGVRAFADEHGTTVAGELSQPAKAVRALLSEYLEMQIAEFGDLHGEVEKALNGAAGRWQRFPPERGENGPEIPEWVAPADASEGQRRQMAATAALEDIKLRVRSGLLLADWPARKAAADLLIAWRQQCMD